MKSVSNLISFRFIRSSWRPANIFLLLASATITLIRSFFDNQLRTEIIPNAIFRHFCLANRAIAIYKRSGRQMWCWHSITNDSRVKNLRLCSGRRRYRVFVVQEDVDQPEDVRPRDGGLLRRCGRPGDNLGGQFSCQGEWFKIPKSVSQVTMCWVTAVAQRQSGCLMNNWSWVQILHYAGLYLLT